VAKASTSRESQEADMAIPIQEALFTLQINGLVERRWGSKFYLHTLPKKVPAVWLLVHNGAQPQ
jgi:hypothetical protein